MPRRVYIPIFGSGLGHAGRMVLVAERLVREGFEVRFSSSDDAVDWVRRAGFECASVPGLDVGWRADGGFEGLKRTALRFPLLLATLARQIVAEARSLRSFGPNVVLSDSRLSAVVAADLLGIPVVTVLNQIRIVVPPKSRTAFKTSFEEFGAMVIGFIWSRSEVVLVPDLPPPYTVSRESLRAVKSVEKKIRYVGFAAPIPDVKPQALENLRQRLRLDHGKPVVFAQISGPARTKALLVKILLDAAKVCASRCSFILSEGDPVGGTEPTRIEGGWRYRWCPHKDELFLLSDLVVIRGGHTTIAQALTFGKPMILVPIPNHGEQIFNASRIAELQLGIRLDQEGLDAGRIAEAVMSILDDQTYFRRASEFQGIVKSYDGVQSITDAVIELAR